MGDTVIVQGTAVVAPPRNDGGVSYGGAGVAETNQEPSKTGCKDPIFAILFYMNISAICVVAVIYGKEAMASQESEYAEFVYAALLFGVASFLASGVGLFMLMAFPASMIKAGLIFSVVMALVFTVYAFMFIGMIFGVIGAIFFLITVCYAFYVWKRIPFAAVNMLTAGTAVQANLGVIVHAVFFTLLEIGWFVIWAIAVVAGRFEKTTTCNDNDNGCSQNYGLLFLLFLSLFFTQQVLQSCVHVTVAGTVGTWWVAPNESGFCSRGVYNAFIRTITTSFGSICFGSLLVAILQALKTLASAMAQQNGLVVCIAECILDNLQSLLGYFNRWAFIYVGVYGFSYIESGKSVMQLFADRGWDAIIADDLVGGAIFLVCIVIGLIVGGIGVAYAEFNPNFADLAQGSTIAVFLIGFIAGLFICSILLSTVTSGVNTVIVMFADAPQEFEQNHPTLSTIMRASWEEFYPGSV